MTTAPFSQPVSGLWLKPKDIPGHLLLITKVHDTQMAYDQMSAREKLVATFDYVDLDGDGGQAEQFSVSDNHPGIANKLVAAQRNGGMVLGRVTQAPSSQGQPAWILGPYTEGTDDARATAWLAANPRGQIRQPATPAAPAVPTAAAAPAAPAASGSPAAASPAPANAPAAGEQITVTPEIAALLAQVQQAQGG